MLDRIPEHIKGLALLGTGGTASLVEIARNGSLLVTIVGGVFACIGGYWMMHASRHRAEANRQEARRTALEVELKEIELERARAERSVNPFPSQ